MMLESPLFERASGIDADNLKMTALRLNPGRFLGENRKKISRVSGEAHCTALVQYPRGCRVRLENGSEPVDDRAWLA